MKYSCETESRRLVEQEQWFLFKASLKAEVDATSLFTVQHATDLEELPNDQDGEDTNEGEGERI